ncbi:MAG: hypothetical protein U5K75_12205 [Ahrensia sp.]|nr:hypothetical protein [Ahrensia sp.]
MRRIARADENQAEIVAALKSIGASVAQCHAVGEGFPDLCVGWRGHTYLLEIKNPKKPKSDRQLTPRQVEWHNEWRGHVDVVETVKDALAAIGIPFKGTIS